MKTPSSIGLPASKFPTWRKGQDIAIRKLLFTENRFNLLCIPTGGGKTVIYMGHGGADDSRQLSLTATKALQDQNETLFGDSMGLYDMRGRNNYVCNIDESRSAAEAKCTAGIFCERMKDGGCTYYDRKKEAADRRLVSTNYRYWLHDEESGNLGYFPNLVLDEAHRAPDEVCDYAAVEVSDGELRSFGMGLPTGARNTPADWANRILWKMEDISKHQMTVDRRRAAINLARKLSRLCRLNHAQWIGSRPTGHVWRWDLLDPGQVAEDLLFRNAKKVVLVSASAKRKTLELLGVKNQKLTIIEQASTFPVKNRPIYYWGQGKLGRNAPPAVWDEMYSAVDYLIESRGEDRHGICMSHSYALAQKIYDKSKHKDQILLHVKGRPADDVLEEYRSRRKPTLLVSPAFSTGYDFPYEACEYIIIPKMPFPDFSSPLVMARRSRDEEYVPYVTMQTTVQACGRGNRATDDQCEMFILDSTFAYLRGVHRDFAPEYFHQAIRTIPKKDLPPDPPPSLLTTRRRR